MKLCHPARFIKQLLAAALICAAGLHAQEPSNLRAHKPCPEEWLSEARQFVDHKLLPGVLVMVESPEWGLSIGSAGYADLASLIPPTPVMRYRMGGITRLMLTTVILQLEHEQKLVLDRPVKELLGGSIVPGDHDFTLRECLNMRAGLYDYVRDDFFDPASRPPDASLPPEEILYRIRQPLQTDTGTPGEFAASKTGYLLAGMIVEQIENKPLKEVFAERIFIPLKMSDSFYAVSAEIPAPFAHGYSNLNGIPEDVTVYNPSVLGAANAVVATPFDSFAYLRDLFKGNALLNQRSFALMASLANAAQPEEAYGLGLLQRVSERGTWRGFESSIRGYSAVAGYYMQGDALIAVFVNTGENFFATEEIFRNVLRRVSGCPADLQPADGERVKLKNGKFQVSWQAGLLYGDSYRVYWGTEQEAVRTATAQNHANVEMLETDGTVFHSALTALIPGRTYYWRVEAFRKRRRQELENSRIYRDRLRENNPAMPWYHITESETVTSPVLSFSVR